MDEDRSLNEQVARRLGWEEYEGKEPTFRGNYGPKNLWRRNGKDSVRVLPNYCNSIQAAWKILEIQEWQLGKIKHPGPKWIYRCGFLISPGKWVQAEADTAPKAICLTFLKLC